jgi:hypothetical protein
MAFTLGIVASWAVFSAVGQISSGEPSDKEIPGERSSGITTTTNQLGAATNRFRNATNEFGASTNRSWGTNLAPTSTNNLPRIYGTNAAPSEVPR